ncbi:MAG TPA: hypothetical protein DDW21_04430 [Verrucomicrobiales bacterium]|nr:MAG: hypothetical protein CAK88_11510 [Verrucomicrobiae bacterium AMD-G2]HBE22683.1 hypothetical protein [Verrucomicrobiales bacterium]
MPSKEQLIELCQAHPVLLFLAIAILPGMGFPASPLLIAAGVAWGGGLRACSLAISASAINMTWTYFLATGIGKPLLLRLFGKRLQKWEAPQGKNLYLITAALRLTPGIPFFLQNYALGIMGIPFLPYILMSIPLSGIYMIGFVVSGGAILSGNIAQALAGMGLILLVTLLLRFIRSRSRASKLN